MAHDEGGNDIEAFETRVLAHLASLYNLARWLSGDEHDAHDLVQETVLKALRARDQLRGDDPRPWLMSILRNAFFSARRAPGEHREDHVEYDDALHGDAALAQALNPEVLAARGDDRAAVNAALARLPAAYREVIILKEIEDMSYKDIAHVAGIPIGTVMSRLARGRRLLAAHLQNSNLGGSDGVHRVPHAAAKLH